MFKLDEIKPKTFEFEFEGNTYSLPSRTGLPMKTFRRIRKAIAESGGDEEVLFDEIMKVFDEYIPEVMERIDLKQAMALFKAYSDEDDGASLGES